MSVSAIIAAAGRGTRLGGDVPKQLLDLGGRTILRRSVDALLDSGLVRDIIVVLPEALAADGGRAAGVGGLARVRVVAGGARRQDSVAFGFDAVDPAADVVLVHDGARPFVTRDVIARTIEAARVHGAAVAAVRSRDTVKQAAGDDVHRVISATLPRDEIWLAQTPQGFRYDVLKDAVALGRSGVEATDEAALAERAGRPVTLVEGDILNMKITTEGDLRLARALAGAGPVGSAVRTGLGYDLHRFVRGRPLVLGGVRIEHDFGLAGHSDADAIAHAVTDAVLGAITGGDIGSIFPDSDPCWKDADSMVMLAEAVTRMHAAGFAVSNVDVVVIAERPKIGPHRQAIRESLGRVLAVSADRVSVKGKTNEGVDAIGRGEALAVHAVATLARISS